MKILTLARLKKMDACFLALEDFKKKFSSKAQISKVYHELTHPKPEDRFGECYQDWLVWLLAQDKALTVALLEQGADVNVADKDGWTPFRWTVDNDNTEMAEFLLEKGVDVNAVDKDGWTPLKLARNYKNTEMIKLLKSKGAKS